MPFKVLHIIPSLAKGGAEKLTIDICRELSTRMGVEAKILVFENKNEYPAYTNGLSIEVVPSYVRLRLSGKTEVNTQNLEAAITRFSPDVIHTHLFEAELPARWSVQKGVRYFSHAHWNTAELKRPTLKSLFSKKGVIDFFVYNKLLNQYNASQNSFITISEHTTQYYKENLPGFESRIHYLPNAINTQSYLPQAPRFIGSNSKVKLISVGSLIERKNQLLQIQVAARLKRMGVNFELCIVGQGSMKEFLQNQINETGLSNEVFLNGPSDNIEDLYRQADIFIHTATYEPFGLVIVEALAAGLPVVCYNGGGNKELIQSGVNGYLLNSPDPVLFAEKILETMHPATYKSMSENAISSAQKYDIVPYVDKLLHLYKSA
jgi:glycosyltransferase involved in cell wall biosynthesis